MSLPRDLLEQADHLAIREPKRPKQASLRRSVSSAYYALFHLLIRDAAFDAAQSSPSGLRELVQRVASHVDMKNVCKGFAKGNLPPATQKLLTLPLEPDLITVANAFVELQEARHEADYDVTSTWNRMNVLNTVQIVHGAFSAWSNIKTKPNATVFRAALLFQKNWGR